MIPKTTNTCPGQFSTQVLWEYCIYASTAMFIMSHRLRALHHIFCLGTQTGNDEPANYLGNNSGTLHNVKNYVPIKVKVEVIVPPNSCSCMPAV
jgi:hypothetical protein